MSQWSSYAAHNCLPYLQEKSGAALRNWQAINDPQQLAEGDEASPPRRQRHDSPDESPPRRRTAQRDESPLRRQRHDSPDTSPPRKQRHDSSDKSPPRKPRSQQAHDVSPPRRQRHDSSDDASPPRRAKATVSDASPPRRRKAASPDESPPRRPKAGQPAVAANGSGGRVPAKNRPKEGGVIMSDGTAAGELSRNVDSSVTLKKLLSHSNMQVANSFNFSVASYTIFLHLLQSQQGAD